MAELPPEPTSRCSRCDETIDARSTVCADCGGELLADVEHEADEDVGD